MCTYRSNIRPLFVAENINDHSKAGAFAKAVFCWQLAVFVASCAERSAEHLPLSLLEITTLAHSLCGLVAFALWWHKPHSVDEAIVVAAHLEYVSWIKPQPGDDLPILGMVMFLPERNIAKALICSLAVACIYGLPHLLALSTDFPTLAERRCWQVATAIITGTPLPMLVLAHLSTSLRSRVILVTVFIAYSVASCFIVAESFRQLFALPSGAFISLAFVCYLPHFS